MPSDDDDERPTEPAAPRVRCPECAGQGKVMRSEETQATYRRVLVTCSLCEGASVVDRSTFAAWHNARRHGRSRQ